MALVVVEEVNKTMESTKGTLTAELEAGVLVAERIGETLDKATAAIVDCIREHVDEEVDKAEHEIKAKKEEEEKEEAKEAVIRRVRDKLEDHVLLRRSDALEEDDDPDDAEYDEMLITSYQASCLRNRYRTRLPEGVIMENVDPESDPFLMEYEEAVAFRDADLNSIEVVREWVPHLVICGTIPELERVMPLYAAGHDQVKAFAEKHCSDRHELAKLLDLLHRLGWTAFSYSYGRTAQIFEMLDAIGAKRKRDDDNDGGSHKKARHLGNIDDV